VKTLLVTIQVDDIKLGDLDKIEELIEEALQEYQRKRITYNLNKLLGPPIPVEE
jgi:hypothetical protein